MKMIKGSGQIRKLCYCCHEDEEHSRYIMPTGLLFTRIVNGKFMQLLDIVSQLDAIHVEIFQNVYRDQGFIKI